MSFYPFRQNNTGGSFTYDKEAGLSVVVIIEAHDVDHANALATARGLYFDGVEAGPDCACCGDRWYRVLEYDATDTPQYYGKPIHPGMPWDELNDGWRPGFDAGRNPVAYIHYLDGRVEPTLI